MSDGSGALDVVTVVYRRELPALALQARSIARFLDPAGIGRIFVIINDAAEAGVAAEAEALRPAYGPFAGRLEVVTAEALFARRPGGPRGLRQRAALWLTRHRRLYPLGVKGGWRGNRGWSVQQALKLAAGRLGDAPALLILDAKNHFVRPVGLPGFVAPDGRPRTFLALQGEKFSAWVAASFAFLGAPPPPPGTPTPPTITPVVVSRAQLLGALEAVEARAGPVEAFFARARAGTSEFMLVHAHAALRGGGWDAVYAPGLVPPSTIARTTDAAGIDRALSRVEAGEAETLAIHAARLATLDPATRARIETIWRTRGLDAAGVFPSTGLGDRPG